MINRFKSMKNMRLFKYTFNTCLEVLHTAPGLKTPVF